MIYQYCQLFILLLALVRGTYCTGAGGFYLLDSDNESDESPERGPNYSCEDLNTIYNVIFTGSGSEMNPGETLYHLKRFAAIREHLESWHVFCTNLPRELDELICASKIAQDACDLETFSRLKKLRHGRFSHCTSTLVPYLDHYIDQQKSKCHYTNEELEDLTEIHDRLFDTQMYLEPAETLKKLKHLYYIYLTRTDSNSIKEGDRIKALIDVSEISNKVCNLHAFYKAIVLTGNYYPYPDTIVPFLEHHVAVHIRRCQSTFFSETLNKVSVEDKEGLNIIFDNIDRSQAGPSMLRLGRPAIIKGLLALMESRKGPLKSNSVLKRRKKYNRELEETVYKLCKRVQDIFQKFTVVVDSAKVEDLDKEVSEWIDKVQLCRIIVINKDEFTKKSYDVLYPNKWKKYLGCLSNSNYN